MLYKSLSSISNYPNEQLLISYNPVNPPLINSRVGVRFKYFYYGDDERFNLTNSEYPSITASIPATRLNRNYVLSSYNNGVLLSAKTPTNFLTVNDFTPFYWTVNNSSEYLDYNLRGGLSAVTIFPSHPFPKITKISNNVLNVSCGLAAASGFDGQLTISDFKKFVKNSNYSSLSTVTVLTSSANLHKVKSFNSRQNFVLGNSINDLNYIYFNSIGSNIYDNSFRITVPVVTSTKATDPVYYLNFVSSDFSDKNNDSVTNGYLALSCLRSEDLENAGINFPYTYDFPYNRFHPVLGEVYIFFKQLLVKKGFDVTVSFRTSASNVASNIVSCYHLGSNHVGISANQSFGELYMYDYTLYGPNNTRDALTISFEPSSRIVSSVSSAVNIETAITDNYGQNTYTYSNSSLLLKRFIETSGDGTLLAKDSGNNWYASNEWMPFSANMTLFNRNNIANKYSFRIEMGNDNRVLRNDQNNTFQILLNKEKAVISPIITENGSSSATVFAVSLPYSDALFGMKWDAFPPENIVFTKMDGTPISRNVFYDDLFQVKVLNLGVDKTKITFYSSEFETSASTFWFPPTGVAAECQLELKGETNDFSETGNINMSALWLRNGYSYRTPLYSNIVWNETANDSRGKLTFRTSDETPIDLVEGSVYAGDYSYSTLNCSVSTQKAESNPKTIVFDVNCNVFGPTYNFITNKTFLYRQYPVNDFLSIVALTSVSAPLFNSDVRKHYILKSPATINLSSYYPNLIALTSNMFWTISSHNKPTSSFTGESSSFYFNTLSSTVAVRVVSAKPFYGNFGYYDFTDNITFFNLPSIQPLNYISFPENKYDPVQRIAESDSNFGICGTNWDDTVFNIYTESDGVSSYKSCHTENFYFSATPGFDTYVWKIGTKTTTTTNNKVVIPLSYNEVSSNNNVYLSAFNSIFIQNDPVTIYNSASSDNSNIYKQPITFLDFPTPTAAISIDNSVVDTEKYGQLPTLTCNIDSKNTNIQAYNFNIVLSSSSFVQTLPYENNTISFSKLLKIGKENGDFTVNKNSFNTCKLYVSGNVQVNVDGFDFCSETKTISSNTIDLTAFNGPSLDLYCENNFVSSGQTVYFINDSNKNFFSNPIIKYDYFLFDAGEGSTITTTSSSITAVYSTQGTKSPSITGFLSNSAIKIQTWNKMVFVKNDIEQYDENITREFSEKIQLPYSLQDCKINPNDWQFSSNINSSLEKLKTNFEFLSSSCYINNLNFPKAFGGFLATKFGNFKWHTDETISNLQDDVFINLKSGQIIDDKLLVVNDNKIEIYSINQTPELLYSSNKLGDGEVLENPVRCKFQNNRLYILDSAKQLIFVCDFDLNSPQNIKLTHYWGGFGSRQDKTKLNNPVDFCLDDESNLFIVDKDSYIIKVYNKNLNWIKNIDFDNFSENNKPVAITSDGSKLLITTQDRNSFISDINAQIYQTFNLKENTKAFFNHNHYGIIYTIKDNIIKKYTLNQTYVNEHSFEQPVVDVFFDDVHCYAMCQNFVYKFVDMIQIDSILNSDSSLSGFSWKNIFINENEFVTDYIYNDSFKKIKDNIFILNDRIQNKLVLQYGNGKTISNQTISSYTPNQLSSFNIQIGTNEPVLYDTINRSIESLYSNLNQLKENISVGLDYPNINNSIKWIWKYHFIDTVQKPNMEKSPITWDELNSSSIINTMLSSASSWCSVRYNLGNNNHSEICFNYSYTRSGSYIPFKWSDMQQNSDKCNFIRAYRWNELSQNCCETPDFIFEDCKTVC